MDPSEITCTPSSGNVFADLGLANADELQLKSALAYRIATIITKRRLTQARAADVLGVDQPKISALVRGRLTGFSVERLMQFLTRLDRDIEIRVKRKPRTRERGQVKVVAA